MLARLAPVLLSTPGWVLRSGGAAALDRDYVNNRAWVRGLGGASLASLLAASNSTGGYATSSAGLLTSIAANTLRRSDLGLLVEESRTNLAKQSQTFTNASWTKFDATASATNDVAPDGTSTGNTLTEDTSNASHCAYQQVTLTGNTQVAVSLYGQAGTKNFAALCWEGTTAGNYASAVFNFSTGAAGETKAGGTSGTVSAAGIFAASNSWFRAYSVAAQAQANPFLLLSLASAASGNTWNTTGEPTYTGTSQSVKLWGAQIEAGAFPTSYIPTTTTTVTRSADAVTGTRAGTPSGGIVLSATTALGAGTQTLWQWDDGTANNRIRVYRDSSNNIHFVVTSGGVDQADLNLGAVANNTAFKIAARWNTNSFGASLNGGAESTDVSGSVPTGLTTIRLGSDSTPGNFWNSTIKRETIFASDAINTRTLST